MNRIYSPSMKEIILSCLAEGPATSDEIALETGFRLRDVSSVLNVLAKDGMIKRIGEVHKHKVGRSTFIWDFCPKVDLSEAVQ